MKKLVMLVILIIFSNFVYAEEINIPETFTAETSVNEVTTYYYAGDKLLADENNKVITYHYQDRLGSDVNSKTLPFGQEIINGERFSFTGKELDDELYYFNARYYDSNLGRFTSVDPVEDNHPYSYVANNPMNYVDPSGMDFASAAQDNTATPDYIVRDNLVERIDGAYREIETRYGANYDTLAEVPSGTLGILSDPVFLVLSGGLTTYAQGARGLELMSGTIKDISGIPFNFRMALLSNQPESDILINMAKESEKFAKNTENPTCLTAAILNYLKAEKIEFKPKFRVYTHPETKRNIHANIEVTIGPWWNRFHPILDHGEVYLSRKSYLLSKGNTMKASDYFESMTPRDFVHLNMISKKVYAMPRPPKGVN